MADMGARLQTLGSIIQTGGGAACPLILCRLLGFVGSLGYDTHVNATHCGARFFDSLSAHGFCGLLGNIVTRMNG